MESSAGADIFITQSTIIPLISGQMIITKQKTEIIQDFTKTIGTASPAGQKCWH